MDEQKLRRILQSEKNLPGRRGWRCPDENQLIEYVSGGVVGERREELESHFADCDSCPEAIAFLSESDVWSTSAAAPPNVVSRARALVKPRRANWRWSWAMTTVAVTCVLFVVAAVSWRLLHQQSNNPETGSFVAQQHEPARYSVPTPVQTSTPEVAPAPTLHKPRPAEAPTTTTRGKIDELTPTLLSPREGEILKPDKLQFRWTSVQEAISYDLRVADLQGGLIFTESTTTPNFHPDTTRLQTGKYFVTIVAHLRDGRTAKSKLLSFRIAP